MANTRNTHGSLTVLELVISPKNGPALHVHRREDEVWYVLEGDFRFKAGSEMFWVSAGGLAFGPRGTPHSFQNVGETPGRLLVITAPSGAERLFEDFADLLPGPVSPEMLATVARNNWVEFVGPQLKVWTHCDSSPEATRPDASRHRRVLPLVGIASCDAVRG